MGELKIINSDNYVKATKIRDNIYHINQLIILKDCLNNSLFTGTVEYNKVIDDKVFKNDFNPIGDEIYIVENEKLDSYPNIIMDDKEV